MSSEQSEYSDIWDSIQREQANLQASRAGEARSTSDWIDAVVQRVLVKHNAMGGSDPKRLVMWTKEMVLETWLVMAIQENHGLKEAVQALGNEINEAIMENVPPGPDEKLPPGAFMACLLMEGPEVSREAVDEARLSLEARVALDGGMSYRSTVDGVKGGRVVRAWTSEGAYGLLCLNAWLLPDEAIASDRAAETVRDPSESLH